MTPTFRAGLAVLLAAGCATPPVAEPEPEPEPEFDDLDPDTTLRGPKAAGPPRILDAERLAEVLEGIPYRGVFETDAPNVAGKAHWELRESSGREPPGYVHEGRLELTRADGEWKQILARRVYAADPPHRIVSIVAVKRSSVEPDRRIECLNGPRGISVTETVDGVREPPEIRASSRETIARAAAIYVDPEHLTVGAMQSFTVFDAGMRRDTTDPLEVVGKGPYPFEGRVVPTVVFQTETAGRVAVAGGRWLMGFRDRSGQVELRRTPRAGRTGDPTLDSPR